MEEFQPTRPVRGATWKASVILLSNGVFQPTRPVRGATGDQVPHPRRRGISTHAPREGRDVLHPRRQLDGLVISTHAPREGRDAVQGGVQLPGRVISTHAPREGRDSLEELRDMMEDEFQPTRPVRGATL